MIPVEVHEFIIQLDDLEDSHGMAITDWKGQFGVSYNGSFYSFEEIENDGS